MSNAVLKRLHDYGGKKQRLSQLLDEEQQRELEEERQLARPPRVIPCEPYTRKLKDYVTTTVIS